MSDPQSDSSVADSPFWRFSLGLYAEPGVAPACLTLQEEAGVDVNVLLVLLFLANSKRAVDAKAVRALDASIAEWREHAVKGLRGVRRWLKKPSGDVPAAASEKLRSIVKKCELEAERLQQLVLEARAGELPFTITPSREDAARTNIAAYSAGLAPFPNPAVDSLLHAFAKFS